MMTSKVKEIKKIEGSECKDDHKALLHMINCQVVIVEEMKGIVFVRTGWAYAAESLSCALTGLKQKFPPPSSSVQWIWCLCLSSKKRPYSSRIAPQCGLHGSFHPRGLPHDHRGKRESLQNCSSNESIALQGACAPCHVLNTVFSLLYISSHLSSLLIFGFLPPSTQ